MFSTPEWTARLKSYPHWKVSVLYVENGRLDRHFEAQQVHPRDVRHRQSLIGRVESTLIIQTDEKRSRRNARHQPDPGTETFSLLLNFGDLSNEIGNVCINLTSFPAVSSSYKLAVK